VTGVLVSADDAEQDWLRAGPALTNRQIGERPGSPSRRR
jgi:hypothetical protein